MRWRIMDKKEFSKVISLVFFFVLIPSLSSLAIGQEVIQDEVSLEREYTRVHTLFLYKSGKFVPGDNTVICHIRLKEGKEYVFRSQLRTIYDNCTLTASSLSGGWSEDITWNWSATDKEKVIKFNYTPLIDDDYTITLTKDPFSTGIQNYSLYVNQTGFAGWWWMLLSGVGILVALFLIIFFSIRAVKARKKAKKEKEAESIPGVPEVKITLVPISFQFVILIMICDLLIAIPCTVIAILFVSTDWAPFLFIGSAVFGIYGIVQFVRLLRYPKRDKSVYIFDNNGVKIHSKDKTEFPISWEFISNISCTIKKGGAVRSHICTIETTDGDSFSIRLDHYLEINVNSKDDERISKMILDLFNEKRTKTAETTMSEY